MTPSSPVSELAREEETFRYAATLLSESVIKDSPELLPRSAHSTSDAALAAFAQLGALRLNVDRAIISLFDGRRQHIVAEATSSTAIEGADDVHHDDHNRAKDTPSTYDAASALFFLGTAIPRGHGACEHVLDLPATHIGGDDVLPISIVPDLTQDERFNSRPYFHPGATMRFYAGVPLRSPQGIDIGVFCVFDTAPRDALISSHQRLLRHLSGLAMSYLQSRASAESYRRNERMVRGLGSMVEGTGSISKWRGAPNPTSFVDVHGKEGSLNAQQQHIQKHGRPEITYKGQPPTIAEQDEPDHVIEKSNEDELVPTNLSGTPRSDDEQPKGKHSFTTYPENPADEDEAILRLVFSRAANIIRESIEVEGALFLDASIGSYGGLVRRGPKDPEEQHLSSSSSGNESAATDDSTEHTTTCGIMGFSNSDTSSINGDPPAPAHATVPETFLSRILRRYPEGQIFNFNEAGLIRWGVSDTDSVDSGEEFRASGSGEESLVSEEAGVSESKPSAKRDGNFYRHPRPRRGDGALLQRMFPKARSVAVFPLWDSHKEKWHAGGFVWTMAPSRIFTVPGELSYLRAFGSAVMAEVARIDVLRADKAKEDVLGSLSHEIRSPLHGIILGLELMHDTALDPFQEDVLHTVETCGRTLLDTMDHLLDFSKVNHFLRSPKRKFSSSRARGMARGRGTRNTIEAGMMSLFSNVSLDALLEEVVESIYAGFSFQQTSGNWATRDRAHPSRTEQAGTLRRLESVRHMDTGTAIELPRTESGVSIYLSIDPTVSWNFWAQPGALRRVMMNIFGNALKYTTRGSILVSLTQEPSALEKRSRRRSIIFSISDSGRGISSDFLQNRLFTPFTQENQLSTGSGLGLSIVKQIVHGLGGRIGVESKAGYGTTVRVSIPLRTSSPRASPNGLSSHQDEDFKNALNRLYGVKVSLLGFAAEFGPDKPLAAESATARLCPRLFMETMCRHYLNLNVLSEPDEAATDPSESILLCNLEGLSNITNLEAQSQVRPVIVVCNSILSAHELSSKPSSSSFPVYISQPIGPRKLAKSLTVALQRWDESKSSARFPADTTSVSRTSNSGSAPETHFPTTRKTPSTLSLPVDSGSDREDAPTPLAIPNRTVIAPKDVSISKLGRPQPVTLQSSPSPPREKNGSPHSQASVENNSFLLVDDNAINLKILASYMKKLGRNHDNAMNGLEALEACRSRHTHYKCIFMDISMPVMDGLEATRHIRSYEQQNGWDPALVIALTGLGSAKTQQEAFASGVDLFLTKPVPLKELGRILESRGA